MKKALYFLLMAVFVLSFIIMTGCEKSQMTETEKTEELSAEASPGLLAKSMSTSWTCHGWALNKANPYAGYPHEAENIITQPYVEQKDGPAWHRIIEWQKDHSGFILSYTAGSPSQIITWEWLTKTLEDVYRTYYEYIDDYYNWDQDQCGDPFAGEVQYWWRVIPQPDVEVEIDGPSQLDWDEEGEFYADAEKGYEPYSNYKWWWCIAGEKGGKDQGIKGPPPGEWQYLSGKEGQSTIEWGYEVSFDLKCRVYDTGNNTAEDVHQVYVNQK
jgi:hypothetical protein